MKLIDHRKMARNAHLPGLNAAGVLLMTSLVWFTPAIASQQKKPPPPDYALVAGSVFNPQGALIPNAEVEVRSLSGPHHHWDAVTDEMGEFYVRVPTGKADYQVRASAPGYIADQQVVHVTADERETIFLHLTRKK